MLHITETPVSTPFEVTCILAFSPLYVFVFSLKGRRLECLRPWKAAVLNKIALHRGFKWILSENVVLNKLSWGCSDDQNLDSFNLNSDVLNVDLQLCYDYVFVLWIFENIQLFG